MKVTKKTPNKIINTIKRSFFFSLFSKKASSKIIVKIVDKALTINEILLIELSVKGVQISEI